MSVSSDITLVAVSVDVLCAKNLLTYNEVVDISLADCQTKKTLLDHKLNVVSIGK